MEKFVKVVTIIVLVILIPIIFVNGVIIADSVIHPDEVPSFFGWKPFIVLSGSMETEIMTGDLVVTKEINTSKLKEGDVIAFKKDGYVTTHRIKSIENVDGETRYITKGDNNNVEDEGYVTEDMVEGIFKSKITGLGNLAMFVQTPSGMVIALSIPLILLILVQVSDGRNDRKKLIQKQDDMEKELQRLKQENEDLKNKSSEE